MARNKRVTVTPEVTSVQATPEVAPTPNPVKKVTSIKSSFQATREIAISTALSVFAVMMSAYSVLIQNLKNELGTGFDIDAVYADDTHAEAIIKQCYQIADGTTKTGAVKYRNDNLNRRTSDLVSSVIRFGRLRNQKLFDATLAMFDGDIAALANTAIDFGKVHSIISSLISTGLLAKTEGNAYRIAVAGFFGYPDGTDLATADVLNKASGKTLTLTEVASIHSAIKAYKASASLARATKLTATPQPVPDKLTFDAILGVDKKSDTPTPPEVTPGPTPEEIAAATALLALAATRKVA